MTDNPGYLESSEPNAESRPLCPEADKRAAMDDGEFWDYMLNSIVPGEAPTEDGSDWEPDEDFFEFEPWNREPCPECGGYGACAYDQEGRPLIHAVKDHDEGEQNDRSGADDAER